MSRDVKEWEDSIDFFLPVSLRLGLEMRPAVSRGSGLPGLLTLRDEAHYPLTASTWSPPFFWQDRTAELKVPASRGQPLWPLSVPVI